MPKIMQRLQCRTVVQNPSLNVEETFNYKEDISKLSGKHAFKSGYDLMRLRRNNPNFDNNAGIFTLAGTNGLNANGTSIPNTGGNVAQQFADRRGFYVHRSPRNLLSNLPRNWIHSLFFQDDWKFSRT